MVAGCCAFGWPSVLENPPSEYAHDDEQSTYGKLPDLIVAQRLAFAQGPQLHE
jgi:hypothetical protein